MKSSQARVLCAEDEEAMGALLRAVLGKEGYSVTVARTGAEFLNRLPSEAADLFLLDLHLPDAHGLDLLRQAVRVSPGTPAVVLTASESVQDVVEAMKRGAVDYLTKPFEAPRLLVSLRNALRLSRQKKEIDSLRSDLRESYALEHMVGSSDAMKSLRDLIARAAPSEATVLISGESGTGKELVARALHFAGARREGPFVDVNSAALAETLLESELFGHEKGAFTGALTQRRGKFEQAHGGTIFLDEIGDMPAATQAKILRVLEERRFQRVGGADRVSVSVRVLCATNRNLEEEVKTGRFRNDLFYRINTMTIEIPPLRDRLEDIPELARHFLLRACRAEKRPAPALDPPFLEALARHSWPGNVRELQHAIERSLLVSGGGELRTEHLPAAVPRAAHATPPAPGPEGLVEAVETLERSMILTALEKNGWVKSRAARNLRVTERILSYKMQTLGIDKAVNI